MTPEDLHIAFEKAVQSINAHTEPFPADVLLNLYAYYKRATNSHDSVGGSKRPLISAFKTNAIFQTKNITQDEAKELYIETVKRYFLYRK